MAQQILSTNTFTTAKWIVSATASDGTHTTIAAALTSASSGDTIFIRPGTYTENLTLKAGVNLASYTGDSDTPTVTIIGKASFSAAGTVTISNIRLQTNSDNFLAVTGSAASVIILVNCYLNCTNNTGISFTTASASSNIQLFRCSGNLGTTGIAFHSMSATGGIIYEYCNFGNTGGSSTVSNNSAGTSLYFFSFFGSPIGSTSTGAIAIQSCAVNTAAQNATSLTANGTGSGSIQFSSFESGSASAVTVGAGVTINFQANSVGSSNTNAITGAGSISAQAMSFTGSSHLVNTTSQIGPYTLFGNSRGDAPIAGALGERISASATAVATSTATAKTITSISLSAGIWDITGMSFATPTGGTGLMTTHATGISTTDNTLTGTGGINFVQSNVSDTTKSNTVATIRATLTGSTTYYLVVLNTYSSTTCPTNALITATRVG